MKLNMFLYFYLYVWKTIRVIKTFPVRPVNDSLWEWKGFFVFQLHWNQLTKPARCAQCKCHWGCQITESPCWCRNLVVELSPVHLRGISSTVRRKREMQTSPFDYESGENDIWVWNWYIHQFKDCSSSANAGAITSTSKEGQGARISALFSGRCCRAHSNQEDRHMVSDNMMCYRRVYEPNSPQRESASVWHKPLLKLIMN